MSPSPWTPEQETALRRAPASEPVLGALRCVITYVGTLQEIASATISRLAAIQKLLVEKGVLGLTRRSRLRSRRNHGGRL
jgi:hypothetical protein